MHSKIINQMAAAFATVDFTSENSRIAELTDDIARMEDSISIADARRAEINRAMREERKPDGRVVADALLDGASTIEAAATAPTLKQMEHEKASLTAGILDLQDRISAANDEISYIRSNAFTKVREATLPVVDVLIADAREASAVIATAFASLSAIADATTWGRDDARRAGAAVHGISSAGGLLNLPRSLDVPTEIVEALANLAGKGSALRARLTRQVPTP